MNLGSTINMSYVIDFNMILERIKKKPTSILSIPLVIHTVYVDNHCFKYVPPNGLLCLKMYQERWHTLNVVANL